MAVSAAVGEERCGYDARESGVSTIAVDGSSAFGEGLD